MKPNGTGIQVRKWGGAVLAGILWATTSAHADLIAQWKFNGNLNDSTTNGFNLTMHGDPATYVTTDGHQCLQLNGTNQYAYVSGNGNILQLNAQSFTIAAWLYPHTTGTPNLRDVMVAGKANNTSFTDYAMTLDYLNATNNATHAGGWAYTGTKSTGGYNVTPFDVYVNMVMTYDKPSNTLRYYVNGTQVGSAVSSTGPIGSTADLQIGKAYLANAFLHGDIDEVQIYNQSASTFDVATLYNGGNGPGVIPEPSTTSFLLLGFAVGCRKLWHRKRA